MKPSNPFSSFLHAGASLPPQRRRRLLALASFGLAAGLLYLVLRQQDWAAFLAILTNARYDLLPLVFAWGSLAFLVHALRWRLLVQSEKPVRLVDVFFANMVGFLGNTLLPAQAGSLARSAYLLQMSGASASFSLATQVVQRIMDTVALIVVGGLALAGSGVVDGRFQAALGLMSLVAAAGLLFLFVLPRYSGPLTSLMARLPGLGSAQSALRQRALGILQKFLNGLDSLRSPRRAAVFILLTLLIRLMDGLGAVLSAQVLNIPLSLLQGLVLLAGWGLASFIPLTPGEVGVFQVVAVLVLAMFGVSEEQALALALFTQVAGLVMVSVWSLIGLLRSPYRPPAA